MLEVGWGDLHVLSYGLAFGDIYLDDIGGTGAIQLLPSPFNDVAGERSGDLQKLIQLMITANNLGEAATGEVVVDLESW